MKNFIYEVELREWIFLDEVTLYARGDMSFKKTNFFCAF